MFVFKAHYRWSFSKFPSASSLAVKSLVETSLTFPGLLTPNQPFPQSLDSQTTAKMRTSFLLNVLSSNEFE